MLTRFYFVDIFCLNSSHTLSYIEQNTNEYIIYALIFMIYHRMLSQGSIECSKTIEEPFVQVYNR